MFHFEIIWQHLGFLLSGALVTLQLLVLTVVLSVPVGILGAMGRMSKIRPVRDLSTAYVEFIRNTPLLVQLYAVYFGTYPLFGVSLSGYESALIALVIHEGAYLTEIFRAGILGVHRGQMEAALSLGMSYPLAMRRIILPQALRVIFPALSNQLIATVFDTSLASVVSVAELTFRGIELSSWSFRSFETYVGVGIIYLIMTQTLSVLLAYLGKGLYPERSAGGRSVTRAPQSSSESQREGVELHG